MASETLLLSSIEFDSLTSPQTVTPMQKSNAEIPDELRDLEEDYQDKVRDGDINKRHSKNGYLGKGYKYSREEEADVIEKRR